MTFGNKLHAPENGNGADIHKLVRDAERMQELIAGLPATQYEAQQAIDAILDQPGPSAELSASLDRYAAEMTPSERSRFLVLVRDRALMRVRSSR